MDMLELLQTYAIKEGINQTPWPDLVIFRADQPAACIPVVYEPSLCIVAQGRKTVYLDHETFIYDPLNYLVVGLPLPVEAEITEASQSEPFLSLKLNINLSTLNELLIDINDDIQSDDIARAIYSSPMSPILSNAVLRLLKSLCDHRDRRILAPLAIREILYHILIGEQGGLLRSLILRDSRSHRIGNVLGYMQDHYQKSLGIDELAEKACMSPSSFYHNFKSVTSLSPLQYLKMIRLHQARLMMINTGANAAQAGQTVGYNSASQFSREFKRTFGVTPGEELKRLNNNNQQQPTSSTIKELYS